MTPFVRQRLEYGECCTYVVSETSKTEVLTRLREADVDTDAVNTADPLPTVAGDGGQLRQMFGSLLDYATEYIDEGTPRGHVGADRTGSEWTVSVCDEGIGVDPEHQGRIFEVFQRLHGREEHAGTGIRLALCRRIVERHGGDIRVESEPGAGSTFQLTVRPASETDSVAAEDR